MHWLLRGVFSMSRRRAFISGRVELAAGADGAVAGHGGEDVVFVFFDGLAAADLGEFANTSFGERDDVGFAEHGGDGADGEGVAAMSDSSSRSLPVLRRGRRGRRILRGTRRR